MTEPTRKPLEYASRTDEELEKLAWDIVGNQVFGTWSHPDAARLSFLVLRFFDPEQLQEMRDARIAHVYEHMSKASERSINGLPMFLSLQMLDMNDTEKLVKRIEEIEAFKKQRDG